MRPILGRPVGTMQADPVLESMVAKAGLELCGEFEGLTPEIQCVSESHAIVSRSSIGITARRN